MGSLKPGAQYIYERDNGITYAREFGAAPETREVIGWDYKLNYQPPATGQQEVDAHNEWVQIRLAGKMNPALQKAIDNVIILYKLSVEQNE